MNDNYHDGHYFGPLDTLTTARILGAKPPEDLRDVDSTTSKITGQEARYPEDLELMTGR